MVAEVTADEIISGLISRARQAQMTYAGYDQQQVDEVVTAVGWKIMDPATNRRLSEQAVSDTGLGNVEHKITKNYRKTLGLLRDLKHARTVGVIAEYPDRGLMEIARPVGVVAAVTPSTNPVATPFNKTLNSLKGGNAVILAPSPKGESVCVEVVKLMRDALGQVGAPEDLVQKLPAPIDKEMTMILMQQSDLVVITGSQNNVRAGVQSGTPAIGVGAGNVAGIIDETADIEHAAANITASKLFDNATSCSSENSIIILDALYDQMLLAMQSHGARLLTTDEKELLRRAMWPEGKLNPLVIARSANEILDVAGIAYEGQTGMIMVEEDSIEPSNQFCNEKLSPVLTVFRAHDFDHAIEQVHSIYAINGAGHSVGMHSRDDNRILRLGLELPVCRVIVNQAHCFATGGSFDNGLPFSLSMGCGTWGGNVISDNMNYRHYINTTRIVKTIAANEPELSSIFGDFWNKYNIKPDHQP